MGGGGRVVVGFFSSRVLGIYMIVYDMRIFRGLAWLFRLFDRV